MTLLLVDVGNSRIKWARVVRGRRQRQHGEPLRGDGSATFRRLLRTLPSGTQALAVSVAGRGVERALAAAVRSAGAPAPRFLRSTDAAAGVVNGYDEAWRLGADRWAALIGARQALGPRRAACVVDIGTAMTLDLLDATGRHRGGYIVAGPTLAVSTLLRDTRGILRRARGGDTRHGARGWPRSTLRAVKDGSLAACAAMILRCHADARRVLGGSPRLVLSGGGAPELLELLPASTLHVPDLVLQGVQVALGGV